MGAITKKIIIDHPSDKLLKMLEEWKKKKALRREENIKNYYMLTTVSKK